MSFLLKCSMWIKEDQEANADDVIIYGIGIELLITNLLKCLRSRITNVLYAKVT